MTPADFSRLVLAVAELLFVLVLVAAFLGRFLGDLAAMGVHRFLLRRSTRYRRFTCAERRRLRAEARAFLAASS